jgi:hypothetical protein
VKLEREDRPLAVSRRTLLVGASAFGLAAALGSRGAHAADTVGLVTSSFGSAFLKRAEEKIVAKDGVAVFLHDRAETSDQSRLELLLGKAIRIKLGAEASFDIDRFVPGIAATLRLEQGAVLVDHGSGAEPDLELETPYGLIAARGTKFWGGPSNGVFGVFVIEGAVEVHAGGQSVTVASGQGTDLSLAGTRRMSRPTSPHPWNHARIQAALQSVQ